MLSTRENVPWIEKYRPKKLSDLEQFNNLKQLFHNNIVTGKITHYIFHGAQGTGKTSAILAIGRELFKNYFSERVIEFNASDDRGINVVRDKIANIAKGSANSITLDDGTVIPPYKIIVLDEADAMTEDAQDALRVIIEKYSKVTRFAFICNRVSKITDAIKSRCSIVYFRRLSNESMINKLMEISNKEDIKISSDNIKSIIDVSNGDMRKAIMLLQNIKYAYGYKLLLRTQLSDMTEKQLEIINEYIPKSTPCITDEDIYRIACSITSEYATQIVTRTIECARIKNIQIIAKEIISIGYPIDTILSQLNNAIISHHKIKPEDKAVMIDYSSEIFLKIRESADEYIQLLDYLAAVNGIYRGYHTYKTIN